MTSAYKEALMAIERAADALESAEYNLKGGFITATANRTYYASYYCMMALLYTKSISTKTHQGIRAKFSEHFIKTKIFSPDISDSITLLFDSRQEADYDLEADISIQEAKDIIQKATEFYQLCKEYLQKLIIDSK